MKKIKNYIAILLCLGLITFALCSTASALSPVLAKVIKSPDNGVEYPYGAAVDSNWNSYHLINTTGTLGEKKFGSWDPAVAKVDKDGNVIWIRQWGGTGSDFSYNIKIDEEQGVGFIVGYSSGGIAKPKPPGMRYVGYVIKFYLSTGYLDTTFADGGIKQVEIGTDYTGVWDFDIDIRTGNYIICGDAVITVAGELDKQVFIQILDRGGNELRTTFYGTTEDDLSYSIDVDPSGNYYYLSGSTDGTFLGIPTHGISRGFMIKTATDGSTIWIKELDRGPDTHTIFFNVEAARGAVYSTVGEIDRDWIDQNGSLIKYSSAGDYVWRKPMEHQSPYNDGLGMLYVDQERGYIYTPGWYHSSATDWESVFYIWNSDGEIVDRVTDPSIEYIIGVDVDVPFVVSNGVKDADGLALAWIDDIRQIPAGTDVTATIGDVTITFNEVTEGGELKITQSLTAPKDIPGGYYKIGEYYYVIETTAGFTPGVTITFNYDATGLSAEEEKRIEVLKYSTLLGAWVQIAGGTAIAVSGGGGGGGTDGTATVTPESPSYFKPVLLTDPAVNIEWMISRILEMNLQQGIENSLDVKLSHVQEALAQLKNNAKTIAINNLQAFVNEVNAQSGKNLTEAQADELKGWANNLIEALQQQ